MAWNTLATVPVKDTRLYVDTSVIIALTYRQGRKHNRGWAPKTDDWRAEDAVKFLKATVAAGATSHWTMLQYEEMAHVFLKTLRSVVLNKYGFGTWKEFCTNRPKDAEPEHLKVSAVFREILVYALDALSNAGVSKLALPIVPVKPEDEAKVVDEARLKHRDLLLAHPKIDAMDALHVVVGHIIGCKAFVTLDRAWQTMPVDGYVDVLDATPKNFG